MEAGDETFVRTVPAKRTMTTGEVVSLLEDIATQIEAQRTVSFRTKDAIRLLVDAVTEALS